VAERDEMIEAYREFIREQTLRFERAMRELVKEIRAEVRAQREEFRAEIRAQREEIRAQREESRAHRDESRAYFEVLNAQLEQENKRIDDVIEENRAQRCALLQILDRLDNGGAAPAT
jgi:septal ring factor EnvC (AmiA/AmiB activator)